MEMSRRRLSPEIEWEQVKRVGFVDRMEDE